jgi:hypothetical protein
MIRCVPGGGVGEEPEANEEEEDVELEGVLKWKAEGKSVIFLNSFGGVSWVFVNFFLLWVCLEEFWCSICRV